MRTPTPLLLSLCLFAACQSAGGPLDDMADRDTHSFARPDQVRTTHLDLDLMLDFDQKVATGLVTHHLERLDRAAPFVVDTADLNIRSVTDQRGDALPYEVGSQPDEFTGAPLTITLADDTERVQIRYATSPAAEAMQWLSPEQTTGKQQPFLFTQGQAILTRSWIPLQDSPAVRVTWDARITAPADMVPVMSAEFRKRRGNVSTFHMSRAVPPYLIALACGDLTALPVSGRCAVWAEPEVVEKAAKELADLERMVRACEELFGPYRWGRYDVLFLPPSFPFGGMENPCMTFATPTILAGDKSLVALIAHELAHSWSGNLVTNATWRDFWLNEGFTVYLEQRIMEHVYGLDRANMEIALGMQGLQRELRELPPDDQILHIDLTGRNPDDGMTAIAYDKGAAFLRRLEQVFGRERLDAFLRQWFDEHAFQSVTTGTFLAFLQERLLDQDDELAAQVDVERWVKASGLPDSAPVPDSELFAAVDRASQAFAAGTAGARTADGRLGHAAMAAVPERPADAERRAAEGARRAVRADPQRQQRGALRVARAGDAARLPGRGPPPGAVPDDGRTAEVLDAVVPGDARGGRRPGAGAGGLRARAGAIPPDQPAVVGRAAGGRGRVARPEQP